MIDGEQTNPLQASDDDFLNMVPPSFSDETEEKELTEEEKATAAAAAAGTGENAGEVDQGAGAEKPGTVIDGEGGEAIAKPGEEKPGTEAPGDTGKAADPAGSKAAIAAPGSDSGAFEGKSFSVPVKFKANGKEIELRSEEEALSLMQMGANYTKRMQELQPHRKVLMMLQNNQLGESDLSFLIDVKNGDPEAIKKLIKDSGIDPLEIDTNADSTYLPGSHMVTDEEAGFHTVLQELSSSTAGKETLATVNTWDKASKEVVWKSPEILTVLHEQRENGIYADIAAEVERRMTLGVFPATTPFLQAYQVVGDEMAKAAIAANGGTDADSGASGTPAAGSVAKPAAEPVATRVATPKPSLANGDQAAAAASTRASPAAVKAKPDNPLALSDEAFLKQMEGRV